MLGSSIVLLPVHSPDFSYSLRLLVVLELATNHNCLSYLRRLVTCLSDGVGLLGG